MKLASIINLQRVLFFLQSRPAKGTPPRTHWRVETVEMSFRKRERIGAFKPVRVVPARAALYLHASARRRAA